MRTGLTQFSRAGARTELGKNENHQNLISESVKQSYLFRAHGLHYSSTLCAQYILFKSWSIMIIKISFYIQNGLTFIYSWMTWLVLFREYSIQILHFQVGKSSLFASWNTGMHCFHIAKQSFLSFINITCYQSILFNSPMVYVGSCIQYLVFICLYCIEKAQNCNNIRVAAAILLNFPVIVPLQIIRLCSTLLWIVARWLCIETRINHMYFSS